MKLLYLRLHREFFDAIRAGEKAIEYRKRGDYWDRRLRKPHLWTHVKFINGYGPTRPWLIIELSHIDKTPENWEIHLGAIIQSGNLSAPSKTRPSK